MSISVRKKLPKASLNGGALQLDLSHPLTRGLVGLWVFNNGAASTVPNLAPTIKNNGSMVAGRRSGISPEFPAVDFNGTSSYCDVGTNQMPTTGPMSFAAIFSPDVVLVDKRIIARWNDSPTEQFWLFDFDTGGVVRFIVRRFNAGNRFDSLNSSLAARIGSVNRCVVTTDGGNTDSTVSSINLLLNGTMNFGGAILFTGTAASAPAIVIGANQNGSARTGFCDGKISLVAAWNRQLTRREMYQFHDSPQDIFYPLSLRYRHFISAAVVAAEQPDSSYAFTMQ